MSTLELKLHVCTLSMHNSLPSVTAVSISFIHLWISVGMHVSTYVHTCISTLPCYLKKSLHLDFGVVKHSSIRKAEVLLRLLAT